MKIHIAPVFRVSFGLLMLTLSILFVGEFLGLLPNKDNLELKNRLKLAESLAIQFSSLAQDGNLKHIRTTMQGLVDRNDEVLSAAFHSGNGNSNIEAGDHTRHWTVQEGDDVSTRDQIVVPIFKGGERWGALEVRFGVAEESWLPAIFENSFAVLLIFVSASGFVLYYFFLKRVMRELDPSQVVPKRVKAAFDSLSEGVLILDESGNIVLANNAFADTAALDSDTLIGTDASNMDWSLKGGAAVEKGHLPWNRVLESGESVTRERLTIHKGAESQRSYAVNCTPIQDDEKNVKGVITTLDDVTELEQKNERLQLILKQLKQSKTAVEQKSKELEYLATRDPLTGCLNRRAFNEQFDPLYNLAIENNSELVCIMIDIDHFKRVNDNYGHSMGDKVIKFVADTVQKTIRQNDLLARYGGEEFCLILEDSSVDVAVKIADRMRLSIKQGDPSRFTSSIKITASFGLATIHKDLADKDELVNNADKALYQAKETGRNKVIVFEAENTNDESSVVPIDKSRPDQTSKEESITDISTTGDRIKDLQRIAEEKAQELDRYATHDSLTDLPVRSLFVDRVEQALLQAQRQDSVLAVLSLGLVDLHRINDTLGYEYAEGLLRETAVRLSTVLRSTDTVSLMTPDDEATISKLNDGEFGILLSSSEDTESLTWIVKRIFDALQEPLFIKDHSINITCDIGIGVHPKDGFDASDLIKKAGIARYYAAKQSGDNNVEYFSEDINQTSRNQLEIESQLSNALDNEEFEVFYQPKIDLNTGTISGFESLVRWRHPVRGLLTPYEFIDVAERTRLINSIGYWVFQESCKQIHVFDEQTSTMPTVAVNLSPVQLSQPDLAERIIEILEETGVHPDRVELELTEGCLMENMDVALSSMKRLREHGIKISIDDFGTGYSSLGYLRTLPIDCLKIDRCFVTNVDSSAPDQAIISAIIMMAKALGLTVVAEGIETTEELAVLSAMSCDVAQGYLFSRPVPAEEATEMLRPGEDQLARTYG